MYQEKIRALEKAAGIFTWEKDPTKDKYEYISPEEQRKAVEKLKGRHDDFVKGDIGNRIKQYTRQYVKRNNLSPEEKEAKLRLAKEIAEKHRNEGFNKEKHSFINGTKKVDIGVVGATATVADKPSHAEEKFLKGIINKETGIRLKHDSQYKEHLSKKVDDLMEEMLKNHKSEIPHEFNAQKHLDDVTKGHEAFLKADKFRKMRNVGRVGGLALGYGGLMYANHLAKKREQEKRD